jgi:hypothetical protein
LPPPLVTVPFEREPPPRFVETEPLLVVVLRLVTVPVFVLPRPPRVVVVVFLFVLPERLTLLSVFLLVFVGKVLLRGGTIGVICLSIVMIGSQ